MVVTRDTPGGGVLRGEAVVRHLDPDACVDQFLDQRPVLGCHGADVGAAVQVDRGALRRPATGEDRVYGEAVDESSADVVPGAEPLR
jgi:hypothetical protein